MILYSFKKANLSSMVGHMWFENLTTRAYDHIYSNYIVHSVRQVQTALSVSGYHGFVELTLLDSLVVRNITNLSKSWMAFFFILYRTAIVKGVKMLFSMG